jgi:hypothetical protein
LKTRVVAPCGTDKLYPPSGPVKVPTVVPLTVTDAPGIVRPSSWLVTVPETSTACPSVSAVVVSASTKSIRIFFIND